MSSFKKKEKFSGSSSVTKSWTIQRLETTRCMSPNMNEKLAEKTEEIQVF